MYKSTVASALRRHKLVTLTMVTFWIILGVAYVQFGYRDVNAKNREAMYGDGPETIGNTKYLEELEAETDPDSNSYIDTSVSDKLKREVRVLCLILTTEWLFETRARVVNATWARRCNSYYFVLGSNDTKYVNHPNVIVTPFKDNRDNLIYKVEKALKYVYNNLIDTFDWILKADDDTYVIMENLRHLLSNYDREQAGYLGFHFNMYLRNYGYMSGGAGYVFSNNALRRLVELGFKTEGLCEISTSYVFAEVSEDFEIAKCLKMSGVTVLSSQDSENRETFHPYPLKQYLLEVLPPYLLDWANNKQETGIQCCSPFSISYHYMNPRAMLLVDHLLYRTSVFGRNMNMNQAGTDVYKLGPVVSMIPPIVSLERLTHLGEEWNN